MFEPQFLKQSVWYCGWTDCDEIWLYRSNAPVSTFTQPSNIPPTLVAAEVSSNGTCVIEVQLWHIYTILVALDVSIRGIAAKAEQP